MTMIAVGQGLRNIANRGFAAGAAGEKEAERQAMALEAQKTAAASQTMGTGAGIGGMVGAVAGIISDKALGSVLDTAGNSGYFWAFLIAGSCYVIILGLVHLLMPNMTPLDENLKPIENKNQVVTNP